MDVVIKIVLAGSVVGLLIGLGNMMISRQVLRRSTLSKGVWRRTQSNFWMVGVGLSAASSCLMLAAVVMLKTGPPYLTVRGRDWIIVGLVAIGLGTLIVCRNQAYRILSQPDQPSKATND